MEDFRRTSRRNGGGNIVDSLGTGTGPLTFSAGAATDASTNGKSIRIEYTSDNIDRNVPDKELGGGDSDAQNNYYDYHEYDIENNASEVIDYDNGNKSERNIKLPESELEMLGTSSHSTNSAATHHSNNSSTAISKNAKLNSITTRRSTNKLHQQQQQPMGLRLRSGSNDELQSLLNGSFPQNNINGHENTNNKRGLLSGRNASFIQSFGRMFSLFDYKTSPSTNSNSTCNNTNCVYNHHSTQQHHSVNFPSAPLSGGISLVNNNNSNLGANDNGTGNISSCRSDNITGVGNNVSSSSYRKDSGSSSTGVITGNNINNAGSVRVVNAVISSSSSVAFFQLLFGTAGIFSTYLYYGNVQEDLFRYRDPVDGSAFTYVWFLQLAESSVTILLGYAGRYYTNRQFSPAKQLQQTQQTLPTFLFFQSGTCQLLGKALMAMSLAAGLSFPVVVLAKSAKVVPVMLGQFVLGGSSYSFRDYLFALLIVAGTALLSFGSSSTPDVRQEKSVSSDRNTTLGLLLIFLSLVMDGVTGGLQKKLKRETKTMVVTTYDFLFYSHSAMFVVALFISIVTGELPRGHEFLLRHLNQQRQNEKDSLLSSSVDSVPSTNVLYLLLASCVCSALGQCFIFYVIATFDPLVCTTITTTRKMASVLYSILFKGHQLSYQGVVGLILGISALFIEIEQQINKNRKQSNGSKKPQQQQHQEQR